MEQSPSSEADSHSASKEIPGLWNPNFHYRVHNSPPPVPTLSQINPVHKFPPYFPNIQSNIILLSTPTSSEWVPHRLLPQSGEQKSSSAFLLFSMHLKMFHTEAPGRNEIHVLFHVLAHGNTDLLLSASVWKSTTLNFTQSEVSTDGLHTNNTDTNKGKSEVVPVLN
jgi:hypothetical protein